MPMLCWRMWCWCGSVLMALLPATSPNSALLLPLLQVVSISGQPRRAYYKFPLPRARTKMAGRASLSRDHLRGTVFLLLYGDQGWLCTLSRDNWMPICSTSDVLANRRNIHHRPSLMWCFRDSGAGYKTADLLTSEEYWVFHCIRLLRSKGARVFTALQYATRGLSDRKGVCLSVTAWIVTKRKHLAKKVQLWLIGSRQASNEPKMNNVRCP